MQRYGKRMQQRSAAVLQFQVLARHAKLPDTIARDGSIAAHLAIELVRSGHGLDEHMDRLAYALNSAMLLAELHVCAQHLGDIVRGQEALMASHAQSHAAGVWLMHEPEYTAVCKALLCYDEQLKVATRVQILAADQELDRRSAAGLAVDDCPNIAPDDNVNYVK